MRNSWNIQTLFEEISRLETAYDLFEKEIDGVYFWKLIRFPLFIELSQKLALYEDPHPGMRVGYAKKIASLFKRFVYGTLRSPLLGSQKVDVLLCPHPRKVRLDSHTLDIYSAHLEEAYRASATSYMVLERPELGNFPKASSSAIRYDEHFSAFTLPMFFAFHKTVYEETSTLLNGLDAIAGIPVESIRTLSHAYLRKMTTSFKRRYGYYKKVLEKHSPKQIVLAVSYGMEPLICAARDLKIETLEIQHGTLNAHHIGYSFAKGTDVPYFPDRISMWGKYWYDVSNLPIDEEHIALDGFHFLDRQVAKYANTVREAARVLFISQGTIGKRLSGLAIEYATKNPRKQVVYRLHPSETAVWKTLYPELNRASGQLKNLHVETQERSPLYHSFALSPVVVGVYSTALIESIAAGCRLILVDLPGVEFFQDLVDKRLVTKIADAEALSHAIDREDLAPVDVDYFFHNSLSGGQNAASGKREN